MNFVQPVFVGLMTTFLLLPIGVAAESNLGDPEAGKEAYARCIGCHSLTVNRAGPKHCGLFNRKAGTQRGFNYSEALRNSGLTWDAKTLNRFLEAPLTVIPGTIMGYAGVKDPKVRADLVAYLIAASDDETQCPE